jgi:DNA-binding NarL/FixJ family response regulator
MVFVVSISERTSELTPREYETAALAASGLSNKQIAQTLGLAEGTIKLHLHSVFIKLGIHRRAHLILHAERLRQG